VTQSFPERETANDHGAELINWDDAAAIGARLVRRFGTGPTTTPAEARHVVADLRRCSTAAAGHVAEITQRQPGPDGGVLIVDRVGWIEANTAGIRNMLGPSVQSRALRSPGNQKPEKQRTGRLGARVAGAQLGSMLAFLAGKVLGQCEIVGPAGGESPGRLLLVAPNLVDAERRMGVDPQDFRLWVCIHEQTHRTQLNGVTWLRDHLLGEVRRYIDQAELDPAQVLRNLRRAHRPGAGVDGDRPSLLETVHTPEQQRIATRLAAAMSLLEGHAEYVMDAVGPSVIPTVHDIRRKVTHRRATMGPVDRWVRRVIGMDAKMRQYRDGERFVRHVVDQVGMAGFNRVWTSPNTLPGAEEIAEPDRWLHRVR
jgi:coenzyme F420 biosynthesis associated uncharacterized protein